MYNFGSPKDFQILLYLVNILRINKLLHILFKQKTFITLVTLFHFIIFYHISLYQPEYAEDILIHLLVVLPIIQV